MFCLLASSSRLLLSCCSERMSCSVESWLCRHLYGVHNSIGFCCRHLHSPSNLRPDFRSFPAALFFGMGLSGVAPIFHKLMHYKKQPEGWGPPNHRFWDPDGNLAWNSENWYAYATRIPERWKPGKVGVAGHSHQPFHLLMVEVPLYTLSSCGLIYIRWRDLNDC
jgi:predicted membrane channel-forming protein YqfA (hemolysin III family)